MDNVLRAVVVTLFWIYVDKMNGSMKIHGYLGLGLGLGLGLPLLNYF
jgi:4-amino-4-deoxy-L-arabinose transferase-like glycosyltransferase